jgi:3-hydroxyacyl-CoA dehydrogenase
MTSEDMKQIAVVGAGLMGPDIAQTFGRAGNKVVLYDLSRQVLDEAMSRIQANLQELAD